MAETNDMTWDDIQSVNPDDVQTGRNLYIEIKEVNGIKMTKSSAGKIISCIHEGFMPVYIEQPITLSPNGVDKNWIPSEVGFIKRPDGIYQLYTQGDLFYSDPDGDLSKPFTSITPDSGQDSTANA